MPKLIWRIMLINQVIHRHSLWRVAAATSMIGFAPKGVLKTAVAPSAVAETTMTAADPVIVAESVTDS
jgi:hypothetical protein